MQANLLPAGTTCWVLTDGKAGDEVQCLGVAEALGLAADIRRVAPRAPWAWFMPWGPIDPQDAPEKQQSPIKPPYPDLVIASGRRTASYLRHIKQASGGRTFTVYLKDPRSGAGTADFIWAPEHDRIRGENVFVTLTSPHRVSKEKLAEARAAPLPALAALDKPRVGVLIGGNSDAFRFSAETVARFCAGLREVAQTASLMGTFSRRSALAHPDLVPAVRQVFVENGGYLWDGTGDNPYLQLLAQADAIIATADSVNMVGEAAATGRPIYVFRPDKRGNGRKIEYFLHGLEAIGAVRPFTGRLEYLTYEAIDSTPAIAEALCKQFQRFRAQTAPR